MPLLMLSLVLPVWAHETGDIHSENEDDSCATETTSTQKDASTGVCTIDMSSVGNYSNLEAVIYYNEACGMCAKYVNTEMPIMLKAAGISNIVKKDYINEKSSRTEMNKIMSNLEIPLSLQSHIMTFVGEKGGSNYKYVLGGHVPKHIIEDLFTEETGKKFSRFIVYQDKMHGDVEDYKVLAIPTYAKGYVGKIQTYKIDTRVSSYFDYLEKNKEQFLADSKKKKNFTSYKSLLPIVLLSGFLDGINPCAFAVLLFFIAFLFSLKRTRASIWKMGAVYIGAIFLAYILIGFGLTKAIMFSNAPHFMAKLGAWLVIGLGLINLINYFFPKFPIKLRIPMASKETLQAWIHKATLPAAFVLGFLVGLCTFPCSGGIYVAIIGLLAVKTSYFTGVGYLFLYNIMFVLPLIIILFLSSNKLAVDKITKWEQSESKIMKILSAIVMIALGLGILLWFT